MSLKCKNEKCKFRFNDGTCEIVDKQEYDMEAEYFADKNVCGWIDKLE